MITVMGEVIHCEGLFQTIRKRNAKQQKLADEYEELLQKHPKKEDEDPDDPDNAA